MRNSGQEYWNSSPPLESTGDYLGKGYPNNTQFAFDGGGTSGAFRFVVHNGSDTIADVSSGSALPDGNWHFLVGTCDEANGQITIYVNALQRHGNNNQEFRPVNAAGHLPW